MFDFSRAMACRFAFAIGLLGLAPAAFAQTPQTRTVTTAPAALTIEPAATTRPEGRRARYLERVGRIRDHHLSTELRESSKPVTSRISQERSIIKPKPRRVNLSKDVVIEDQGSVTGTANIDYYWASPISEPTIAVAEYGTMATGNWYAARSLTNGKKFELVDPYKAFGTDTVGGGFCCDQVTIYDKKRQLMIWFMQGKKGTTGNNTVKFLVSRGKEAFEAGQWREFAYDTRSMFGEEGIWLDFPDLAVTNGFLYATLNAFNAHDIYQFTAVMRLPLDALAAGSNVELKVVNYDVFSLRLTQGNNLDRIYFAGHADTGELTVFSWADNEDAPSPTHRIAVERWYQVRHSDTGNAEGPNRHPWIGDRCDSRVTAGWVTETEIGFAWTAARDNRFFRPQVRVAIIPRSAIDAAGEPSVPITPTYEPHIWSHNVGIAYPAAGVNGLGQVGLSIAFAGPRNHPSHAVGFLSRVGPPSDWSWQLKVARAGLSGPKKIIDEKWVKFGIWGDYFSVRPHPVNPRAWVTLGYTLQNEDRDEALKAVAEYTIFSARGAGTSTTPVVENPTPGLRAETRP